LAEKRRQGFYKKMPEELQQQRVKGKCPMGGRWSAREWGEGARGKEKGVKGWRKGR